MTDAELADRIREVQQQIIEDDPKAVVASNVTLADALDSEYRDILRQEKVLSERKEVIRSMLIAMIDEVDANGEALVIGDRVAWKRTKETRVYLKTDDLKKKYPISRYPQFYRETESEVLRQVKPKEDA